MPSSLLATRIQIPHLRQDLVQRRRLIDSIERCVSDTKLTLLAAPAGYGKTTLLSQWANSTDRRVGWVTIDTDCDDPAQLFRYLIASWASFQLDILERPVGLLAGSSTPDLEALMAAFINAAAESEPFAFVLDQCETVLDQDAFEMLTGLIDNSPASLRFLIASRSTPPLPLARFRSRGELQTIGIPDLAFSDQDVFVFAERTSDSAVNRDDFVRLATVLEGWPAGIRLALSSNHPSMRLPTRVNRMAAFDQSKPISGKRSFRPCHHTFARSSSIPEWWELFVLTLPTSSQGAMTARNCLSRSKPRDSSCKL